MILKEPLIKLLPLIDAMNIDLKGFTQGFYDMVGGDLETVKQAIVLSSKACHVEVTTLVIPDENDSESEMEALFGWLASVDPNIPLHISRFYPRYKMSDKAPTPVKTITAFAISRRSIFAMCIRVTAD
jgi:pyruvate formate lyase activating enzyme